MIPIELAENCPYEIALQHPLGEVMSPIKGVVCSPIVRDVEGHVIYRVEISLRRPIARLEPDGYNLHIFGIDTNDPELDTPASVVSIRHRAAEWACNGPLFYVMTAKSVTVLLVPAGLLTGQLDRMHS
ncbi:hypothetical protein BJI67_15710 (plasmid) [Acidihalobacter aeolianus]|uniref:Uncharacterized protein n=1 Tax=Acidihalobacter aeolianus TaxID=2792603 RepID=A0A1D8KCK7_9GAMM|nr:hypothetical protein [Acidihalobacter aeolianus]AOV18692.1 hypothetical protein BJI67_15710 [Acidihalobacter aeolianus]